MWTILLVGHSAIEKPYSWSKSANIAYMTITRIGFALGIFMQVFVFFLSGFTIGKAFMRLPIFIVVGKLCYITGLITPIMV